MKFGRTRRNGMPRTSEGYVGPLLVTAHLASPIAGDPPFLEAILEYSCSLYHLDKHAKIAALEPWKLTRSLPAPPQAAIPIPVLRERLGEWSVARCSAPILSVVAADTVEHVTKRIATEESALVRVGDRRIISAKDSWTKSYRLPLRVRTPTCVAWFCVGTRKEIRKCLRRISSLGKKRSNGFGRVQTWTVEQCSEDLSWFAPHPGGTLLMRPLPAGDRLPHDLIGCRRDFGACVPPFWHPERFTEIMTPCQ